MTPQMFQVVLSLAGESKHGYAIIQDVAERTNGEMRLTASTLYDALARMVDQGYIAEVEAPAGNTDSRRRFYGLTREGRHAAEQETQRLARTLTLAKKILR